MNTDDLMQEGAWSGLPPTESAIVAKSIDRPMPHNNEAERAVISCLFNKCDVVAADVFGTLRSEDYFVDIVNRQLFGVIREMVTEGVAVDAITVVDRIGKKGGDIDRAMLVCADYIVEYVTAANIEYYVDIVRDCYLRREYDYLRREYEDLRRPFAVTKYDHYTDVWSFQTVPARPGKHECEKPVALLAHILNVSTRPDAVVLDCFAGSGTTGAAAIRTGRRFLGIEQDAAWHEASCRRIAAEAAQPSLFDADTTNTAEVTT